VKAVTVSDDELCSVEFCGCFTVHESMNMCLCLITGNCVVLKPSEVSEQTARLVEKLCLQYLDKVCT